MTRKDPQSSEISRLRPPTTFEEMIASHLLADSDIATLLLEVALSDASGLMAAPKLCRWLSPVRMGLIGQVAPTAPAVLAVHAAYLQAATGHQVSSIQPSQGGEANLGVLVSSNPLSDVLENFWPNIASLFAGDRDVARAFAQRAARGAPVRQEVHLRIDDGVIAGGLIAVPASISPLEFYVSFWPSVFRAFGLIGRFNSFAQSVMASDSANLEPTPLDRVLLTLLYSPELKPAMERDAIQTALPVALASVRGEGGFDALAPLATRSR